MKKIFLSLLLVGSLLTSCDMDKTPYGSLDDSSAIQSMNDVRRFRNGIYSSLRSLNTGGFVAYPEIQMDMFHGVVDNGNRVGLFSNGNILSNDGDIESIWLGLYTRINSANYLIEKVEAMKGSAELTEAEQVELARYEGEAKFARAFYYYWLFDHFCESYTAEKATAAAKGLPLVTVYNPTGDSSQYPGRSTMNETFELIENDLTDAYNAIVAYETTDASNVVPEAPYASSYAVMALQARVALLKGDNATALTKAEAVIDSRVYTLATPDNYLSMWTDDTSSEIIYRPVMTASELGSSTGNVFLSTNGDMADYIPTFDMLALYDEGDVRFDAFFAPWLLNVEGASCAAYVFVKYPGNEALLTGATPNYMNMPKVFRLSEMYLIAAEAALATNETKANQYLNDLRAQRIVGYEAGSYTGVTLRDQIRSERLKELIGEGFRMSDLRRWGLGFARNPEHPENPAIESIVVAAGAALSYQAGDHRFVWPIPTAELESNPQMAGQQNPGY